jgi:hypothetical protein
LSQSHHHHDHDHDADGMCQPRLNLSSLADYDNHGIRFRFPKTWELSEETSGDETTISVQSDETSFWTIVLFKSRPDPEAVLDAVVDAFEQDYEEVDVLTAVSSLCGLPSLGRDLDFVCYDLLNSATLRAFQTSNQTVLVIFQGTDHELETTRTQLESISASLECDDEDDVEWHEDEE